MARCNALRHRTTVVRVRIPSALRTLAPWPDTSKLDFMLSCLHGRSGFLSLWEIPPTAKRHALESHTSARRHARGLLSEPVLMTLARCLS